MEDHVIEVVGTLERATRYVCSITRESHPEGVVRRTPTVFF
jgi:hypothetical protein